MIAHFLELPNEVREGHAQHCAHIGNLREIEAPFPRFVFADEGLGFAQGLRDFRL